MGFLQEGMSGKNVNSLQVPKGCSAVLQELTQILGNFLRLTSHNRSVSGEHYSAIIEKLMMKDCSGGASKSASPPGTAV